MRNRLQQLLNVHKGEWGLLIAFFVLIALNTAALEGADVVATSCYLERLEPVARGSDELGQLARVFVQMAIEVQARQERLKI